jgi:two-component system, NtrC family, sensor kinase
MVFFKQMVLPRIFIERTDRIQDFKRYRKLWWYTVFLTLFVAQTPLLIMVSVNHYMFRDAIQTEYKYDMSRNLFNVSRSLKFVIEEKLSALRFTVRDKPREELLDPAILSSTFQNLKKTFGGFVDLGVINSSGKQIVYVGPYNLQGEDYSEQQAFHEVVVRDVHVSDVFMGHRHFPHFVVAVKHELPNNDFYILRATVDMESLNDLIFIPDMGHSDDIFIINKLGILQTPSRLHGDLLTAISLPTPPSSQNTEVIEAINGEPLECFLGYSYIENTPFILMLTRESTNLFYEWLSRQSEISLFFVISSILIHIVVLWSATVMVQRIRHADQHRTEVLLNVEYTNKMATIGRLSASVAHEINNPLAIINEKAGLLTDIVAMNEDFPKMDKMSRTIQTIIDSVERCSNVTHRLLGFTRKMQTKTEIIDLPHLLDEVAGFLEREAAHQNIMIYKDYSENCPTIESDKGQLQQIFLNILNNALAAVDKGGKISMMVEPAPNQRVVVTIRDNGVGISRENLSHIFEPFFSTKGDFGTGLGLSITYGIIQKLGGNIEVSSELNKGTSFVITLPLKHETSLE